MRKPCYHNLSHPVQVRKINVEKRESLQIYAIDENENNFYCILMDKQK